MNFTRYVNIFYPSYINKDIFEIFLKYMYDLETKIKDRGSNL